MTLTAEQEAEVVAVTLVVLRRARRAGCGGGSETAARKAPVVLRAAHTTKDGCIQRGTTAMRPALQGHMSACRDTSGDDHERSCYELDTSSPQWHPTPATSFGGLRLGVSSLFPPCLAFAGRVLLSTTTSGGDAR